MATAKHQRIFIWIIAIVMAVGTIGAYVVIILANENGEVPSAQELAQQKQLEEYNKQQATCPTGEVVEQKVDPAPTAPEAPIIADITELSSKDLTVGTGEEVKAGDCVVLFYHGTLASDGKAFQGGDNYAGGVPYRSSQNGFVNGFSTSLLGMKVGGERQIYIPSALGYGEQANGEIPANADLIFSVKLVSIFKQ